MKLLFVFCLCISSLFARTGSNWDYLIFQIDGNNVTKVESYSIFHRDFMEKSEGTGIPGLKKFLTRYVQSDGVEDFQFPQIDFSNLLILDVMGSRGWELSALSENSRATKRNTIKFYFKRPVDEQVKVESKDLLKDGD